MSQPPTLYVAEQDADLRKALAFAFEADGFAVTACDSGEALLALALPPCAAALVIDNQLSGLSGLQALAALRRRGVTLPAVVLVSRRSAPLEAWAERLRAALVDKPLDGETLLTAVRSRLPRSAPSPP